MTDFMVPVNEMWCRNTSSEMPDLMVLVNQMWQKRCHRFYVTSKWLRGDTSCSELNVMHKWSKEDAIFYSSCDSNVQMTCLMVILNHICQNGSKEMPVFHGSNESNATPKWFRSDAMISWFKRIRYDAKMIQRRYHRFYGCNKSIMRPKWFWNTIGL